MRLVVPALLAFPSVNALHGPRTTPWPTPEGCALLNENRTLAMRTSARRWLAWPSTQPKHALQDTGISPLSRRHIHGCRSRRESRRLIHMASTAGDSTGGVGAKRGGDRKLPPSRFHGVANRGKGWFQARLIAPTGHLELIGNFRSEEAAALAYDEYAKKKLKTYGMNLELNFPTAQTPNHTSPAPLNEPLQVALEPHTPAGDSQSKGEISVAAPGRLSKRRSSRRAAAEGEDPPPLSGQASGYPVPPAPATETAAGNAGASEAEGCMTPPLTEEGEGKVLKVVAGAVEAGDLPTLTTGRSVEGGTEGGCNNRS
ncbi:unnamed protein product, partial [Discosporangium mesarthrocarpum]